MAKELSILLGGSQGQGLQSMGAVITRSLSRLGLHVFAIQDFESRIRGGHTFYLLRTADRRLDAHVDRVDIIVALDEDTLKLHRERLSAHGVIVFDSDKIKTGYAGDSFLPLALTSICRDHEGSAAMANTVALGAVWAVMGLEGKVVEGVLESFFGRKSREVVEKNVRVFAAGYELGRNRRRPELELTPPGGPARLVLSGTEAVGLGALAADLRFYSAYPMTPATGVMEFIIDHQKEYGVVVEQAEDEISALNMAVAAAFMGARSMVGTSGGGFCLMVEALGLAGCIEAPVVVYEAQRPGPATGMPTRTEQGDLLFSIFASQSEFPRVVLAPIDPESAFRLTAEAFNLADRLQTPVIILGDHHLGSSYWTVDGLPVAEVTVDTGKLAGREELDSGDRYLRYRLTEDGVSPRAWPGQGTALVVSSGDEHDESGHVSEDEAMRTAMVDKRWKKLRLAESDPGLEADLQKGADTVIVGWGSSYGAIREAVLELRSQGRKISHLQLYRLWPFPAESFREQAAGHSRMVAAENNSTGQLARLIRMETGLASDRTILKYDGRPFSVDDILVKLG
ncbi:MAG: 2-oxoacid:acceptor oxidoreductase subunit alpha [Candidatus Glassbacteria bacterium]